MPYRPPDRIIDVFSRREADLLRTIGQTLSETFQHALQTNGGKPDEVRMFSSFFYIGLPNLQRRMNHVLGNEKIRTSICGIFCHKTPIVKYEPPVGKGSCELADITFIVTYGRKLSHSGLGNAMMMQAKLTRRHILKEKVQTGLYQRGLRFHYSNVGEYGQDERLLPPKNSTALCFWNFNAKREGYEAGYRFHNRTHCIHPLELTAHPGRTGTFEGWLFDLMVGLKGRGFKNPELGEKRWCKIIFDLLTVTCGKAAGQKNIYANEAQTLRGKVALDAIRQLLGNDCFLVKNSFQEIFSFFGDERLEKLGHIIETSSNRFTRDELETVGMKFDGSGEAEPPQLITADNEDDDGGGAGGPFVLIDIADTSEKRDSGAESLYRPTGRKITFEDD
jgi:hypothetical protein